MKRTLALRAAPILLLVLISSLIGSCAGPQATAGSIQVDVVADGERETYAVPAGSTVQQALQSVGVELSSLDRTDPPTYAVLTDGAEVQVTRVEERFEIEQVVLPFERQTVRNEGLPEGETRLLQAGINGTQEITYRIVEEQGEEISRTPVKQTVIEPPQPEIVMIGAQASFTPISIAGRLAYISGGNAWLMESNSVNRRPLVVTADLDGRIFELSPDGGWLIFSRRADEGSGDINSLWLLAVNEVGAEPIDLGTSNVIHFAAFSPSKIRLQVAYSTVEPSAAAPGWQANNDLGLLTLSHAGRILLREMLLDPNAGGQYGWWGTDFRWAPDGQQLAFARADSIGTIDVSDPSFDVLYDLTPYQTLSDWAWVPGIAWGGGSRSLFFVDHGAPVGLEDPSASPAFDLSARLADSGQTVALAERTGMFAQPVASPTTVGNGGENSVQFAYFQATDPFNSQDSSYRLALIDRDGSNRHTVFPGPGESGLRGDDLRPVVWSPSGDRMAFRYRNDLWIYDVASNHAQQVTGDGQLAAYDWKP
ncbi:MAG: G5 domain-containing protein [Anaerolineales bacterium]